MRAYLTSNPLLFAPLCVQYYTAHILACGWFAVSASTNYPTPDDVCRCADLSFASAFVANIHASVWLLRWNGIIFICMCMYDGMFLSVKHTYRDECGSECVSSMWMWTETNVNTPFIGADVGRKQTDLAPEHWCRKSRPFYAGEFSTRLLGSLFCRL